MEIVQLDTTKLVKEIQEVLSSWLNEKPDTRSVAYLSRETGVSDSAIRRLLNSDVKIADDSIYKLLTHICRANDYDTFLGLFTGKKNIQVWYSKNFAYLKKAPALEAYKPTPIAEIISENPISLSVYGIISSMKGLTQSYIKEQFGVIGEFELEKLVQKEIVTINSDGILFAKAGKVKITKEQVIANLPALSMIFFKKDHVFNGRILNIESVSLDGYKKLMDAMDKYIDDVSTIVKENSGEIPVITAGFMDTLTTVPYFEGGKNEISN